MQSNRVFNVAQKDLGKRLDRFLYEKGISVSRSQIKKLIDSDLVTVDGKPDKGGSRVKPGQVIEVGEFPSQPTNLQGEPIPIDILYEDDSIIVVNKSPNIVVHPAFGHSTGTLVNALLYKVHDLKPIAGELRPGIVHRLDKETSGVMVVAKDEYSLFNLGEQFKNRMIEKIYRVIVVGEFKDDTMTSDRLIGRSKRDRKKMAVQAEKGKDAVTSFRILERLGVISLIEAKPKTGRTHQIRVHLANLGFPVVGDKLYLKNKALSFIKDKISREKIAWFPRQALHSYSLKFTHPLSKEVVCFKVDTPEDMEELLSFIRSRIRW